MIESCSTIARRVYAKYCEVIRRRRVISVDLRCPLLVQYDDESAAIPHRIVDIVRIAIVSSRYKINSSMKY
jgi:hypothetical protein